MVLVGEGSRKRDYMRDLDLDRRKYYISSSRNSSEGIQRIGRESWWSLSTQ
jgi:hypothetical protein